MSPPPAGYRNQPTADVHRANALLEEHGAVGEETVYATRHLARYRAQRVISLLVGMGLRQRWEIVERTWAAEGGFRWSVQRVGGEQ